MYFVLSFNFVLIRVHFYKKCSNLSQFKSVKITTNQHDNLIAFYHEYTILLKFSRKINTLNFSSKEIENVPLSKQVVTLTMLTAFNIDKVNVKM